MEQMDLRKQDSSQISALKALKPPVTNNHWYRNVKSFITAAGACMLKMYEVTLRQVIVDVHASMGASAKLSLLIGK